MYDPFAGGPFVVATRAVEVLDPARARVFPCSLWTPNASEESWPTVVYSHHSGGSRRAATYLCTHLASHGYPVAAMDHSEVVAPELARAEKESPEQRAARGDAWIANRLPDVRVLLDYLGVPEVALVGHSLGGWTALETAGQDPRVRAVVALAPGGASRRKPGILPLVLDFRWQRDVPTLYIAAENDACLPLEGIYELFDRTPASKRLAILRRADHLHFIEDVDTVHEAWRTMPMEGDLARIQAEMLPLAQLCSGAEAHRFVRGLTLAHLDAVLRGSEEASQFLDRVCDA